MQDEARPLGADLGNQTLHLFFADRKVALRHHLAAGRKNEITRHVSDLPAPDVVRPHKTAAPSEARKSPVQRERQMLARAGMGLDDMFRRLGTS